MAAGPMQRLYREFDFSGCWRIGPMPIDRFIQYNVAMVNSSNIPGVIPPAAGSESSADHRSRVGIQTSDGAMLDRRAFLTGSTLILGGLAGGAALGLAGCAAGGGGAGSAGAEALDGARDAAAAQASGVSGAAAPPARLGLVTDLHYADKPPAINRYYRQSIGKLDEAVAAFNSAKVDAAVELGDLVDRAPDVKTELAWLATIEKRFAAFIGPRHYVLGNHCVDTLTKEEFIAHTAARPAPYAFDIGPVRFLLLDACFRKDGAPYGRNNFEWTDTALPAGQIDWLKAELSSGAGAAGAARPVVIFIHQRLDLDPPVSYAVKNSPAVRQVLEQSGRVSLVLQGHSHKNEYRHRGGIHYVTLSALVEGDGAASSGYGLLDVFADGSARIKGFRKQMDHDLPRGVAKPDFLPAPDKPAKPAAKPGGPRPPSPRPASPDSPASY